ncbi:uncharacterized protein LOC132199754 [Neocloeon triangulifer]|uniref:uncharacterized protein LOC132199754 n=1 Tax=Neocloeon triangulifer TaxID=2078957 RepID=UPI00286FAB6D|nr:uncharacterized protein LOC132199754 [Neocloeon triangulifer]
MFKISPKLLIVLVICVFEVTHAAYASTAPMEHRSLEIPRRRPFGILGIGNALGWLLAIKAKIVLVVIAVAAAMAYSAKFWGPGYWGCSTSYSSAGEPWVEEYPGPGGPGKTLEERSDNGIEVESLTSRVMRGIELANFGYKAITESGDETACRARLACEARQIAKESPPLAKMIKVFGSTLRSYESGETNDCEQIGCSSIRVKNSESDKNNPANSTRLTLDERPRKELGNFYK